MKLTDDDARAHWVALSLSPHIGAITFSNLLRHFRDDFAAIFAASAPELRKVPGVGPKIARDILSIDPARIAREMTAWEGQGIRILTSSEACYPAPLRAVVDHPPTLFARGCHQRLASQRSIAIVGTRAPSQVAKMLTLQLATRLARAGCTVVSGLALGIDAAAHAAVLEAGGRAIAVLGSGVLNVYPPRNRALAARIMESGAVVSEAHPELAPNAQRLVARNRIISGLSDAVVLVESAADGGAMHTARFAREQGRKVYTFRLRASGNDQLIRGRGGGFAQRPGCRAALPAPMKRPAIQLASSRSRRTACPIATETRLFCHSRSQICQ